MRQPQQLLSTAKKAADLLHAANLRSAILDKALRGDDIRKVEEAYAAFFTAWEDDFDAAVADNRRLAADAGASGVQLTLFSVR